MLVEFKNLQDKFEIIEHVIRKTKPQWEGGEGVGEYDCLQARLRLDQFEDDCLRFSVSYYSDENEFLGLDHADDVYLTPGQDNSVPISAALTIPERADRAVVRFIFDDETRAKDGFYSYVFKVAAVMALAWFGLLLFKAFSSAFTG